MQKSYTLFKTLRIGVLGGSFNPPHAGHREISLAGLRRLGLDYVLWLVTPGNPLKREGDYAPLEARMAAARECAAHPRIIVSDFEARHGLRYTTETLKALKTLHPHTRFVWMMGADNLATFHKWRDWQDITASVPIAVFNRPGAIFNALSAPAARRLERYRLPVTAARALPDSVPPAWIFFPETLNPASATGLRQANPHWYREAGKE